MQLEKNKPIINDIETLKQTICQMRIPLDEICENLCNIKWNQNAKTFYDMDMDELDVIGAVIEIEKKYEILISDLVVDQILRIHPDSLMIGLRRSGRLDELGI
jgi:acyl carrier protein